MGRTVSVAHCTLHDAQPNIETVSCAIIKGSTPVADIELRLNSGLSPPLDCAESKLTGRCSVTATGTVVEATGGKPGLSDASISR